MHDFDLCDMFNRMLNLSHLCMIDLAGRAVKKVDKLQSYTEVDLSYERQHETVDYFTHSYSATCRVCESPVRSVRGGRRRARCKD